MRYLLAIIFLLISQVVIAQLVVVVAKDSPIQYLEENQVANIFLARTKRYPDGNKTVPIELKNNLIRQEFYEFISGKSLSQLNAYWTTLVFTGKGKPPKSYKNTQALISHFQNQPGSITYMDINEVTSNMKIVYQFPN